MNWQKLISAEGLDNLKKDSFNEPQVIFKHSTRCMISSMAKARLERKTAPPGIVFHYLDLIRHRDVSSLIAETFAVPHESPQVLLIRNGECVYDESHGGINMADIESAATARN